MFILFYKSLLILLCLYITANINIFNSINMFSCVWRHIIISSKNNRNFIYTINLINVKLQWAKYNINVYIILVGCCVYRAKKNL